MFSLERTRWLRLTSSFVILAFAVWCGAQTSRVAGAVHGIVVDQNGSAVAGATVKLRNQGTNPTRTLSANPEGSFYATESGGGASGPINVITKGGAPVPESGTLAMRLLPGRPPRAPQPQ
jgi:hypothetical protein